MTTQPDALRLADLIQSRYGNDINDEAAAELRRLHEEVTELRHGAGVANMTLQSLLEENQQLKALNQELLEQCRVAEQIYAHLRLWDKLDELRAAIDKVEGEQE